MNNDRRGDTQEMAEQSNSRTGPAVLERPSVRGGKFLTFHLDREEYGLEILKVQEIIGLMPITRVPRTPNFIRGVINLRGKVIPVLDLRLKFGMERQADTERTCIIVVQINAPGGPVVMGLLVDEVSEVLNIVGDQIEPPPSFGCDVHTEFITGIGKVGNRSVMVIDCDLLLTTKEVADSNQAVVESQDEG